MIPTQESHQLEFKLSFQDEVIVSLVAFANSKGGTIYIGVADNGEVKGVQIGKETLAHWSNEIKNKTAPVLLPDLEEVEMEGKVVVKIVVPEYPVKPVSTKGRYYKRKGNANHQLSVAEVVEMHLKTLNSSWDAFPDQQHTIEDLSFEKVQAAIDRKNKTQLPTQDDPLTFLNKTGLIRDDKITHAAFFLFHKEESYLSTIELGRFQTEILIKDSARSQTDVLTQIDQVIDFVKKHINLEVIITGEAQNKQIWQYPLEAIREIVINMIVHRDYRSSSDSIVKVFADKIEFYNPGRLPEDITINDLLTNQYRSTPRNKLMADVLKNIGVIEKYGSGIQRIINLFKSENQPIPTFCNISEGFMVTAYSKTDQNPTRTRPENVVENVPVNVVVNVVENVVENQSKIIGFLKENNTFSAKVLANKMDMTERTIQRYLKTLVDNGKIQRIGPPKGGHWQINLMFETEFDTFVELKIQGLVSLIIEHEHLVFEDALQFLYESKLYDALLEEHSKIWHLSNEKLFEMLLNEKQTNELTYPDFV